MQIQPGITALHRVHVYACVAHAHTHMFMWDYMAACAHAHNECQSQEFMSGVFLNHSPVSFLVLFLGVFFFFFETSFFTEPEPR